MNKIVKNAFILTAITVIAGLLLGVVYESYERTDRQCKSKGKAGSIPIGSVRCRFF